MMDILHLSDWNKVLLAVFENGKCVPGLCFRDVQTF